MKYWLFFMSLFMASCAPQVNQSTRMYNVQSGESALADFIPDSDTGSRGQMVVTLASGDVLKGRYNFFNSSENKLNFIFEINKGLTIQNGAKDSPSTRYGTALVSNDKGLVLQCEFMVNANTGGLTGKCLDNNKAEYRLER